MPSDKRYCYRLFKSKSFDDKTYFTRTRARNTPDVKPPEFPDKRFSKSIRIRHRPLHEETQPKLYDDSTEPLLSMYARSEDPVIEPSVDSYYESTDPTAASNNPSIDAPSAHLHKIQDKPRKRPGIQCTPDVMLRDGHPDKQNGSGDTAAVNSQLWTGEPPLERQASPDLKSHPSNSEERHTNNANDVIMKHQSRTEALSYGLHLASDPALVALEEKRRLVLMRKQEELRKQMETNPHLARRERLKAIEEEKRLEEQLRIKSAQIQRLEEESRLRAAVEIQRNVEARRAMERKRRREQRLEEARLLRDKQFLEDEQKLAQAAAKRKMVYKAKLRAAEEARVVALEEARHKADEMEADSIQISNQQIHCTQEIPEMQEQIFDVMQNLDSKFLMDDRREMEILAFQLRRDREIVEQAERLHRATMDEIHIRRQILDENEFHLRRQISEENEILMRRQLSDENEITQRSRQAQLTTLAKSKSMTTLVPKRDVERPKWGVGQAKTQYKKNSERDPNYLLKQKKAQRRPQTKATPLIVIGKQTSMNAIHMPERLLKETQLQKPSELESTPVLVDKSTSSTGTPGISGFATRYLKSRPILLNKSTSSTTMAPISRFMTPELESEPVMVDKSTSSAVLAPISRFTTLELESKPVMVDKSTSYTVLAPRFTTPELDSTPVTMNKNTSSTVTRGISSFNTPDLESKSRMVDKSTSSTVLAPIFRFMTSKLESTPVTVDKSTSSMSISAIPSFKTPTLKSKPDMVNKSTSSTLISAISSFKTPVYKSKAVMVHKSTSSTVISANSSFKPPVPKSKPVTVTVNKSTSPMPTAGVGHPEASRYYVYDQDPSRKSPYMSASARLALLRARRTSVEVKASDKHVSGVLRQVPERIKPVSPDQELDQAQDPILHAEAGNPGNSRPSTTESEITERECLIRYLLSRRQRLTENTEDKNLGRTSDYTIKLPDKYARSSRNLGFRRRNCFLY